MHSDTNKQSFEKTGEDLIRIAQTTEEISRQAALGSWMGVTEKLRKQRKASFIRKITYISTAAASIALLILGGYFFMWKDTPVHTSLTLALLEQEYNNSLPASEIILLASGKQISLGNSSSLVYDAEGTINYDKFISVSASPDTNFSNENDWNKLIVPKGKKAQVSLSDGTKMFVNSGTKVVYPAAFKPDKREILVEGEVFLDVHPDATRPFVAKTREMEIKVLGTQFNINNYRENENASVVLVEGSVEISSGTQKYRIIPNQLAEIDGEKIDIKHVDVFEYICWKDNLMLLNEHKAGEVFDRLSRHYGRLINYGPETANIPISGELDLQNSIEEVIDVICQLLLLTFQINEEGEILISKAS